MPLQSVIVVNTAPGCDNLIEQQISADTCNNYIVRITPNTNAIGPFDVYVDTTGSTPVYSAQTRTQMLNGVVVQLGPCITPTPTPTPSITPTPGVTPTQTQTPSETPTNTPTPSITPSASETPTPTPSFTSTPTQTPTFTPSETPTETPTQTPTETSTQTPTQTTTPTTTPTPTPTESIFIIAVSLQNGEDLLLQGGELLLVQQPGVPFLVSGGDVTCPTTPVSLTQTIYGLGTSWGDNINIFFTDINLTTPFNGGNLFYTNDSAGCGTCYQIDTNGYTSNYGSPC